MNKQTFITALLALVAMAGLAQEITGRVIGGHSQQMAFAYRVMLADSITKNPVCYATVYDTNGTVKGRSDMGGFINHQEK